MFIQPCNQGKSRHFSLPLDILSCINTEPKLHVFGLMLATEYKSVLTLVPWAAQQWIPWTRWQWMFWIPLQ